MNNSYFKRMAADDHNKRYLAEKERLSRMTREERQREVIVKGVKESIDSVMKQVGHFTAP